MVFFPRNQVLQTAPVTLGSWLVPQIVGIGASQSAAAAVSNLVGGAAVVASPGPPDAITSALAGMTRKQLYDIMAQMKGLIVQNPGQVVLCSRCNAFIVISSVIMNLQWVSSASFQIGEGPSALLDLNERGEQGRHTHDVQT